MEQIKVLDCTLRDGGLALEDAVKNGIRTEIFEADDREKIARTIIDSGVDIIEIGSIEESSKDKRGFGIYQNIEAISDIIPSKKYSYQMFSGFYRGPDTDPKNIPDFEKGMLDIVRVCLRYSELEKSLLFAKELSFKGYKVSLQPMITARYSMKELDLVMKYANDMDAYALYFVDSYGYLKPKDIEFYYDLYDTTLKSSIRIGFHAHNNMQMALMNVITLLNYSVNREIMIDACVTGMGQGTGNLCTEIILNYLNEELDFNYDMSEIYKSCEMVERFNVNSLWGYTVPRFISAQNKTAYKYAMSLKSKYNLGYVEIYDILKNIPEELRHRYTADNVKELLERNSK